MAKLKKWHGKIILKFLEVYENHSCFMGCFPKGYKDRIAREEAYLKIAEKMNVNVICNFNVAGKAFLIDIFVFSMDVVIYFKSVS